MMNNQMNNDLTMNHSNLFHFSSPFSLHKIHIAFFVAIGVMGFVCRVYMYYCLLFFDLSSQLLLDHCSALRIKSLEFVFSLGVCACVCFGLLLFHNSVAVRTFILEQTQTDDGNVLDALFVELTSIKFC